MTEPEDEESAPTEGGGKKCVYGTHTTGAQSSPRTPEHSNAVRGPEGAGEEKTNPGVSTHLLRSPSSISLMFFSINPWRYCRTLRCNYVVHELFSSAHATTSLHLGHSGHFSVALRPADFLPFLFGTEKFFQMFMVWTLCPALVQESPLSAHSHDTTYHPEVLTPIN